MPSVIKLGSKCCIGRKCFVKIFLLSVKISLRCFCCPRSIWIFFFCVADKEFGLFGFTKSVDLSGCVINSEKLIMDEENQNKTDSREGVCKQFSMISMISTISMIAFRWFIKTLKVVKVDLEDIIISYYQIKEVFKTVLSIRQQARNKDDWTARTIRK